MGKLIPAHRAIGGKKEKGMKEFHQLLRRVRDNTKLTIKMQWKNKTPKTIKEAAGAIHIWRQEKNIRNIPLRPTHPQMVLHYFQINILPKSQPMYQLQDGRSVSYKVRLVNNSSDGSIQMMNICRWFSQLSSMPGTKRFKWSILWVMKAWRSAIVSVREERSLISWYAINVEMNFYLYL